MYTVIINFFVNVDDDDDDILHVYTCNPALNTRLWLVLSTPFTVKYV